MICCLTKTKEASHRNLLEYHLYNIMIAKSFCGAIMVRFLGEVSMAIFSSNAPMYNSLHEPIEYITATHYSLWNL